MELDQNCGHSKVRIRVRSVEAREDSYYAVAEVLADRYWGYEGNAAESTTGVYNQHEVRLVRNGSTWTVAMDRNLASHPRHVDSP